MATNPTIKPRRGTSSPGAGAINQNELAVDTTNKRIYIGAADGSGTLIGSAPGGADTQVQFNDSGNLGGDSGLTYNKTTDTLVAGRVETTGFEAKTVGGDEGGEILLGKPVTNTTLTGTGVTIDVYQNRLRFFEQGGTARGAYIDISAAGAGVSTNLLSGGGSGTPGGSDTQVQFNDGGSFGGDSGLTYNKTTDTLTISGDLAVNGADITTTGSGTATLFNSNALTLNLGGAATAITMGDSTSATATIRGGTLVGNTTTQNLFNTTATTINMGGAATTLSIGAATGTATINNANTVVAGDLAVNGGDITTTSTGTAALFNTNATTLNIGGAANTINIGAASGFSTSINLNNTTYNSITVPENVALSLSSPGSEDGASITIQGSASPGGATVTIGGALSYNGVIGGSATWNASTIGANKGGTGVTSYADGDILYASSTTTTLSKLAKPAATSFLQMTSTGVPSWVTQTGTGSAVLGTTPTFTTSIVTNSSSFNVFNTTATTLNIGGAATTLSIGAATGTATINNANTVVAGDLAVNGGDITTTSTGTATVFNTTATTVNAFGAATSLAIGNSVTSTQDIFIGNGATVSGSSKTITIGGNGSVGSTTGVYIGSGQTLDFTTFNTPTINFGNNSSIQFANATMSVPASLQIFTGGEIFNIGGDYEDLIITIGDYDGWNDGTYISVDETNDIVSVSAASGLAVSHDLAINGGDITTTVTGTASLFNTNATTLNLGGVSTSITMGATSGTTTTIRGGTLVGNTTTQNLFNTTATTVNAFGDATTVNIGGASTNTVFAGTVEIDGANALKFPDDTIQVTRTPDFLLFDMGII